MIPSLKMGVEQDIIQARYPIWVYLVLFGMAILMAVLFGTYREQSRKLLLASLNSRLKADLERSDSEIIGRVGRLMNLLFFVGMFIMVFVLDRRFDLMPFQQWPSLLQIVALLLAFFGGKYFLHVALSVVFQTEAEAKYYLQDSYLKYKLFGIFLFPILLIVMFSNSLSSVGLLIGSIGFLIVFLVKSFHGLRIGFLSKSFPKHYSFLYICTLEILPLLVAFKFFEGPILALLN